jgi:hypothetical protein
MSNKFSEVSVKALEFMLLNYLIGIWDLVLYGTCFDVPKKVQYYFDPF